MKVKNLVLTSVSVALLAAMIGIFAEFYPMLQGLSAIIEYFQYVPTLGIFIVLLLFFVISAGLALIFGLVGIFCDCGLIKSEKAFKAMKKAVFVLAILALIFVFGLLILYFAMDGMAWQLIINTLLAIALLIVAIINSLAAKKA